MSGHTLPASAAGLRPAGLFCWHLQGNRFHDGILVSRVYLNVVSGNKTDSKRFAMTVFRSLTERMGNVCEMSGDEWSTGSLAHFRAVFLPFLTGPP